jgi:G3E family GTPase
MNDMKTEGRMRLTVLGGFLGSGKTTWLRHQLHDGKYRNAHVIVNEAAEMPVDDALLGGARRLTVLAGGCCCCVGLADLRTALKSICDERSKSPDGRIDEVVLETSGLADPGRIAEAIKGDPILVHHIVISEIIVAVDALHGVTQLQREPLSLKQIEVADRLVVTKVDAAAEHGLPELLATLKSINPVAAISGSTLGTPALLPLFEAVAPVVIIPVDGLERPAIFPTVLELGAQDDWTALTVWLSALLHARGDDVLRVKGVVKTPAGRLLLQSVRKIVQSPEMLPEQTEDERRRDNSLVIIGSGYRSEDLAPSLRRFTSAG